MPATDTTTLGSPTPTKQQLPPAPRISNVEFANSTPVGYGQLDSDDQKMVLRCPVCHCLITI